MTHIRPDKVPETAYWNENAAGWCVLTSDEFYEYYTYYNEDGSISAIIEMEIQ